MTDDEINKLAKAIAKELAPYLIPQRIGVPEPTYPDYWPYGWPKVTCF